MLSYYNFSSRRNTEIFIHEKKILINAFIAGLGKKTYSDKKRIIQINIKFLEYGTLKVTLKERINSQTRSIASMFDFKILDLIGVCFRKISLRTLQESYSPLFDKSVFEDLL